VSGRIAAARGRSAKAKRVLAAAAAASFLAAFVLERTGHSNAATASTTSASDDTESGSTGFGSGSIAPSAGSTPQVQTHSS
jgi:hypothetical protein